jgi:hypothetical protein
MTDKNQPSAAVNFNVNLRTSRIKKGVASCLKLTKGWHHGDGGSSAIPYGAWVLFFKILKAFDKSPNSLFWKCFVYPQIMGTGFSLEWNENVDEFMNVEVMVNVDDIRAVHNEYIVFKSADDFYSWFRLNEVPKNEC